MSTRRHVHIPLLLSVILTGLATGPADAAGPYDGTYRGPLTATEATGRTCHNAAGAVRTVTDNMLSFQWAGSQITVPVAADGSISGERRIGTGTRTAAPLRLTGRIVNNVMTLDTEGGGCGFHFQGRKTG